MNAIAQVLVKLNEWFKSWQLKQLLAIVLVGFILTTPMVNPDIANRAANQRLEKRLEKTLEEDTSKRPKTTGEWQQQSAETQDQPGERLQRIGQQSAEAFKDFGSLYPDTAARSGAELRQGN